MSDKTKNEGGRMGDFTSKGLSASFEEVGIELQRLKTGTPARILGSSIDFTHLEEQKGDADPTLFAFYDTRTQLDAFHVEHRDQELLGWPPGERQVSCWMTYTSDKTRTVVQDNLHRSAMYSGEIEGTGPRYCPEVSKISLYDFRIRIVICYF